MLNFTCVSRTTRVYFHVGGLRMHAHAYVQPYFDFPSWLADLHNYFLISDEFNFDVFPVY